MDTAATAHHGVGHVMRRRVLFRVLAALLVLTYVTVAVTNFDFGPWNLWIAMGVAVLKAALVVLFFMHLKYDKPFNAIVFIVSLALVADAWSRTYRSRATTYAASADPVKTRNGIRIVPDISAADWPEARRLPTFAGRRPADALDHALDAIVARYGAPTGDVVAMQLEYPRQAAIR